jgi:hypothetical protein
VLNHEEFKNTVNRELLAKHGLKFRDSAEINQVMSLILSVKLRYTSTHYSL